MALKIKYTEQKAVPEGVYVARLDGLEKIVNQFGESVKWTFTIQQPQEFVGTQVTGLSSLKVSPKSKMFGWLQALGVVINPDEEFDLETLLGRLCRVRIKNNDKKTVVNNQEKTVTFSNVDALAAYVPPQQNTTAPAQQNNVQPQPQQNQQNIQPQQNQQNIQQNNQVPPNQLDADETFDF